MWYNTSYTMSYDGPPAGPVGCFVEAAMARYPLNLPAALKAEAEHIAKEQGVSLNQFILWALAEKVGALKQRLHQSPKTESDIAAEGHLAGPCG